MTTSTRGVDRPSHHVVLVRLVLLGVGRPGLGAGQQSIDAHERVHVERMVLARHELEHAAFDLLSRQLEIMGVARVILGRLHPLEPDDRRVREASARVGAEQLVVQRFVLSALLNVVNRVFRVHVVGPQRDQLLVRARLERVERALGGLVLEPQPAGRGERLFEEAHAT